MAAWTPHRFTQATNSRPKATLVGMVKTFRMAVLEAELGFRAFHGLEQERVARYWDRDNGDRQFTTSLVAMRYRGNSRY